MSHRLANIVFAEIKLPVKEHHALAAVAHRASDSGEFWASNDYFSHCTGISRRTIQRYKTKWLESGAIIRVGAYNSNSHQMTSDTSDSLGRGILPAYRLDLSVFPKKRPWAEVRGIFPARNDDEQFLRPSSPVPWSGNRPQIDPEKGDKLDTERVTNRNDKGDKLNAEGCQIEHERVTNRASHNKADSLVDTLVDTKEGNGPLPDASSAAHHVLTQINLSGIATLSGRGNLQNIASAIEVRKLQNPILTFADIATEMINGGMIYARAPGRQNWFAFFAEGLYRPEKLEARNGGNGTQNGNGKRSGAYHSGERYDLPPDAVF